MDLLKKRDAPTQFYHKCDCGAKFTFTSTDLETSREDGTGLFCPECKVWKPNIKKIPFEKGMEFDVDDIVLINDDRFEGIPFTIESLHLNENGDLEVKFKEINNQYFLSHHLRHF